MEDNRGKNDHRIWAKVLALREVDVTVTRVDLGDSLQTINECLDRFELVVDVEVDMASDLGHQAKSIPNAKTPPALYSAQNRTDGILPSWARVFLRFLQGVLATRAEGDRSEAAMGRGWVSNALFRRVRKLRRRMLLEPSFRKDRQPGRRQPLSC